MAKYAAAIDQGTTSTRCMVFDHGGQVVSVAQKEHEQIYPKPGWVEHDANEVWARTQEVIDEAMASAGASADDIAGVGITNQRETALVWDRTTGEPIHNALVWQDTRTDQPGRRVLARRRPGPLPGEGRPAAGDLLLRAEDPLDPGQRRRGRREGRVRRPAVRQHGHLGPVEPHGRDRRRPAHHRRDERQPHDADGPQVPPVGRGDHGHHGRPAGDAAGDQGVERGLRRGLVRRARSRASRSPATSATSRRRRSARRASRSVRPRTRTARATSCCSTPAPRRCSRSRAC